MAGIENRQGVVASSKKTKKSQPPPLLYSLTDLQQDANIRFGFSAKQTLEIAQGLYERKNACRIPELTPGFWVQKTSPWYRGWFRS